MGKSLPGKFLILFGLMEYLWLLTHLVTTGIGKTSHQQLESAKMCLGERVIA